MKLHARRAMLCPALTFLALTKMTNSSLTGSTSTGGGALYGE